VIDAVVGLGSNQGDSRQILALAVSAVAVRTSMVACSSLYRGPAVGGPPQPEHLNAAVRLRTDLLPAALLSCLQTIEGRFGRQRTERWGPRTLDLDLLWADGIVIEEEQLELPHPRLRLRRFALVPLLEVAPNAADPRTGVSYRLALPRAIGDLHELAPPGWAERPASTRRGVL
jgi:2-amino-4-hydroxy-6-hydroxymethyldihydropteridine diphosphokinase